MKGYMRCALGLCVCLMLSFVAAQTQLATLSVNDTPSTSGSFYFDAYGNTQDAFAEAVSFAESLNLNFFISDNGAATLTGGAASLSLEVSNSVEAGLVKTLGALTRDGEALESPLAILVDGVYYLPVSPIAEALGGSSTFNYDAATLEVAVPAAGAATEVEAPAPEAVTAETSEEDSGPPETQPAPAFSLAEPRIGIQDDGSTRVVIDLPANSTYTLATKDDVLIVSFPGMTGAAFSRELQDPNISTLAYGNLETDFALFIGSQHALSPTGAGFRSGLIPANEDGIERLYIDFAPGLQSDAIAEAFSSEPSEPSRSQAARKVVVIDAGHGGKDPGTVSEHGQEKDIVLAVALKLRDLLVSQGVDVIMTREDDTFLELEERAAFANPNVNLFISIHVNGVEQTSAHGIETWVFGVPLETSTLSIAIEENGGGAKGEALTQDALAFANSIPGKIVQEEQLRYSLSLADEIQSEMIAATGATDRGIRKNTFFVIRNARTAAILAELGFITNPAEGPKLVSDDYQNTLAAALAKAVQDFLSEGLVATQP